jgi:hypothetical protein
MTTQEKRELIAQQLQYWLDMQEAQYKSNDLAVTDSTLVRPTEWPSRGVLKEWIKILVKEN